MTRLEKLKSLCAAATPGPWYPHAARIRGHQPGVTCDKNYLESSGARCRICLIGSPNPNANEKIIEEGLSNATLIAVSRNELPALLALVEQMAEALRIAAHTAPMTSPAEYKSREALTAFAAWNENKEDSHD